MKLARQLSPGSDQAKISVLSESQVVVSSSVVLLSSGAILSTAISLPAGG